MSNCLYFVSSDALKRADVCSLLQREIDAQGVDLKIDEIQHTDIEEIARDKVIKAFKKIWRPTLVEQTGLHLSQFGGLPGGLTQIFWSKLGPETFSRFFCGQEATAKSVFAYCDGKTIFVSSGEMQGHITQPKGERIFGWDCVFQPDGYSCTLAEMPEGAEKHLMRKNALDVLIRRLGGKDHV